MVSFGKKENSFCFLSSDLSLDFFAISHGAIVVVEVAIVVFSDDELFCNGSTGTVEDESQ